MSDVQKLSATVLQAVAEFLADLPAEHLADLANGAARLTIIPRGETEPLRPAAPKARSRAATAKPSVDMSQAVATLGTLTTREEAGAVIAKMKVAELKALAAQLGMSGVSGLLKEDLVRAIVEFTVGNRINSAAIRAL